MTAVRSFLCGLAGVAGGAALAAACAVLSPGSPASAQVDPGPAAQAEPEAASTPEDGATAHERANMANVVAFYGAAMNDRNFEKARFYLANEYVEHDPGAADGLEGLQARLGVLQAEAPDAMNTIEAVYAEDDVVILHVHSDQPPDTEGSAIVEIYRLNADGKIVEHWNVVQQIPAEPLNENGMFYATGSPDPAPATPEQEAENKALAIEFYDRALNRKDIEAANELMGETYTQHNPRAIDGPEGIRGHIEMLARDFPENRGEIKAAYADGDRVILHIHSRRTPDAPGNAVVDMFRIEDGKVVEHWDVVQPMPEDPRNDNGMFYDAALSPAG